MGGIPDDLYGGSAYVQSCLKTTEEMSMWDLESIRRVNDSRVSYLERQRAEEERIRRVGAEWSALCAKIEAEKRAALPVAHL